MTKQTEIKLGVIKWFQRLANSRNGNPRFKVAFTDGMIMRTAPDAGWVYEIVPSQLVGRPVAASYHMTPSGNAVLDRLATCQPWQDASVIVGEAESAT
jgi:hypothetical protein